LIRNLFVCLNLIIICFIPLASSNVCLSPISEHYQIELNGEFLNAFHFNYRKTTFVDTYSIGLSFINFKNAYVSINNGEINEYGNGLLFLFRFRGIYIHDSNEDNLIINGEASFLKLNMK
jgi:hypothetical protein